MRRSVCTLRKAAMVIVAMMSVVFALFLVWHLVTPGSIGQIADPGLVAVLALLVLPAATAAAWELDRRACRRSLHRESETGDGTPRIPPAARVHGPHAPGTAHRHTPARHAAAPSRVK